MRKLVECGGKCINVIAAVASWLLEAKIIAGYWVKSENFSLYKLLLLLITCVSTTRKEQYYVATSILIALITLYALLLVLEEYTHSHTAHMLAFAHAYCLLTLSVVAIDGFFGRWYLILWIFINYAVAVVLDAWDKRRGCYI